MKTRPECEGEGVVDEEARISLRSSVGGGPLSRAPLPLAREGTRELSATSASPVLPSKMAGRSRPFTRSNRVAATVLAGGRLHIRGNGCASCECVPVQRTCALAPR